MNKYSLFTMLIVASIHSLSLHAATLNISNVPLYLGGAVEPNIIFTLDDSGSMQWEIMPDENLHYANYLLPMPNNIYGGSNYNNQVPNFEDDNVHNFFSRSSANNSVYYNPDITYVPWSRADGSSMGNANPAYALYNPDDTSRGGMALTSKQTQYACWYEHPSSLNSAFGAPCNGNYAFWPITYFIYDGSGSRTDRSNYTKVEITSSTPSSKNYTYFDSTENITKTRTRNEEIQNFANWFQYYRSRILTARAGVGRAFANQSTNMRVGFAAINQGSRTVDGIGSSRALISGVRKFSGSNKEDFFDRLYGRVINNNGTPLRSAANSIGDYFERSDNRGPWGKTPGTNDTSSHLTCRQSYHILTTDGYWNGSSPSVGNSDNNNGSTISGPNNDDFRYQASAPYSDSHSNTLADVAMDYWKRDLRTDLDNEVPTNAQDPAFWQHVVTFTVGLGVTGSLDPDADLPALTNGTKSWPDPTASNPNKIDDLWHAAVNSRGQFFSAADPDEFASSLAGILDNISSRTSSSSSVAVNSGAITSDGKVYQAIFDSGTWTGKLLDYGFDDDGQLSNVLWDAGTKIPLPSQRVITTYDGSNGQPFLWANLTSAQKSMLDNDANILNYLRGVQTLEQGKGNGSYRARTSLLGDIINSSPILVTAPNNNYPDDWGTRGANDEAEDAFPYSTFRNNNKNRAGMLYVGSNDGMLHGFDAESGIEKFAYVPAAIYSNLTDLIDPDYSHHFYVDGSPTVTDAYFDSNWHSILLSGLGAGGQGIFAIDVTNPSQLNNQSLAVNQVLWEFTDKQDSDMGFTMNQASTIRLNNGEWAALFSGGYNNTIDNDNDGSANDSSTGNGVIYLVNIKTGQLIRKFDTQIGSSDDPLGEGRPNGLSSPTAIDENRDGTADIIYAGDLFGNVWAISINGSDKSKWDFTYQEAENGPPAPVFKSCFGNTCNQNNIQPITTRIQVVKHPTKDGLILLFGTGKYFEVGDNSSTGQVTQSFYGIWDPRTSDLNRFTRTNLEGRRLTDIQLAGQNYRTVSPYSSSENIVWGLDSSLDQKRGWYVDLLSQNNANTNNFGERQVSNSIVSDEKIIFTTLVPSDDECDFGGSSWLLEFDYLTGGQLEYQPLDINGDGKVDANDLRIDTDGDGEPDTDVPIVSGKGYTSIVSPPKISRRLPGEGASEIKIMSNAEDGSLVIEEEQASPDSSGRTSWIQLELQ
ncbi:hypothetical protein LCGC14_1199010 [marine sediment metagenome]|uniref:PilY1 beta-propeller domain-containing protein n=1 Tax=marine sediment metagenome TaxID=412755 RepID=A0A0F9LHI9_9ZZZZ